MAIADPLIALASDGDIVLLKKRGWRTIETNEDTPGFERDGNFRHGRRDSVRLLIRMGTVTLITGGARSGKSMQALKLALPYRRKFFVATGQALDEEMTARIEFHRTTRPPDFQTVEEPVQVVAALQRLADRADLVVLDCLTLWISNLMQRHELDGPILAEADKLAATMKDASFASIAVTDEVGSGIVPTDHAESRRFRDLLGWTNQKVAAVADQVILMVAGYSIKLK